MIKESGKGTRGEKGAIAKRQNGHPSIQIPREYLHFHLQLHTYICMYLHNFRFVRRPRDSPPNPQTLTL